MSFFPYPDYKDHGEEWIGAVPHHWRVLALKHCLSFNTGWTPPTGDDKFYEGDLPWANIGDLGARLIITTSKTISLEATRATRITEVPAGSLLFSFKLSVGLVSITGVPMYTNEAIAAFLPSNDISVEYLWYAAPYFIPKNAIENIYGAALLSRDRIANAILCVPPPAEQSAIAAFLDRETGKIDALVAEQERLIALLKEKRQAVISHAVTKGLDPNAKMKDSGVEWLGEVPAHWTKYRLHTRCGFAPGKAHEPFFNDDGLHICVTARFVSTQGAGQKRCSENLCPASFNDILMVMSDLPNGRALARAYLVADDVSYAVNQRVCAISSQVDHPRFLYYLLDRNPCLLKNDDGVNQTHLSNDDFRKLSLLLPPRREQEAIAAYLDAETGRINTLAVEANRAIALLKERRAALISAAVTGKIDVRTLAPQAQEAA